MRRTLFVMVLLVAAATSLTTTLAAQTPRPNIVVLSPEPGERVPANEILIALSVNNDMLDSSSVKIEVDGVDVTPTAEISGVVITWKPAEPLAPGPHRVIVTARNKKGDAIDPVSWTFSVDPRSAAGTIAATQAPTRGGFGARPHGSLIVEGSGNNVTGPGASFSRQQDFLPRAWLNAGGIIAPGWSYLMRVHASGYEKPTEQPVNRYRADLRAPFFSIGVGDVNPYYQNLILSGLRVRGVQGDLRAGPLRISAVGGQTRRAISGLLDPTQATGVLRTGTFGQNLFAVRPAIGSGTHFQFGATVMHVRDDVNSIPDLRVTTGTTDSARKANPPPKDNLVAGLDLTLRMMGGRVLLQYENAASLLANDISGGAITRAGLDSLLDRSGSSRINLDPSKYADWFILNASLIPLDPRGLTNIAHQLRTSFRLGAQQLAVDWRSIGGSYYTLGYPAMERDIRGVRIRDSFTALNDALVVSAAYEQDHDNLDNVKVATTKSTGAYASASWQKSRNTIQLTATARVGTRDNNLPLGRFDALSEKNKAFSGGVSVPVSVTKSLRTRLTVNTSLVQREDPVNSAGDVRDLYYLGGVQAESPDQLSQYAVLFGLNRSELTSQNATTDFRRVLATVRHRFNERLTALFDGTSTVATSPLTNSLGLRYNRLEVLGGGEYTHRASTVLTLTGGVVNYSDRLTPGNNTNEVLVRLRMSQAF